MRPCGSRSNVTCGPAELVMPASVKVTSDLESALRFATEVDCGSIQINSSPLWRSDPMPYGGLKGSGIGKEGPRSAIEEMTELKTVVFHDR